MIKSIVSILLATIWVSISEFVRNEFFLKSFWIDHYSNMGLNFPSEPINGAVWGIWSLLFTLVIYIISKRFTLIETFLLSWLIGFILMWLVIGNMNVLPFAILPYAIPLSLIETYLAAFIIHKFK